MKKMLITSVLSASLMCTTCASALNFPITGNKVELEIPYSAGEETMIAVVKNGGSINNNQDIFALDIVKANDAGKISTDILMDDQRIGSADEYDVYVRKDGDFVSIGSFLYAPDSVKDSFIINNIDPVIANEISLQAVIDNTANEDILKAIGFDIDTYNSNPNYKSTVMRYMKECAGGSAIADADTAALYFNRSLAAVMANNSLSTEFLLEKCGFIFDSVKYEDEASDKKTWLNNCMIANKPYVSVNNFVSIYDTANMLYVINNTRFDDMETVLGNYAAVLGLQNLPGYTGYKNLTSKTSANENIALALNSNDALTVAALDTVIGNSFSTGNTVVISPTGGGGGGGGMSMGVISPTIPQQENPEREEIFTDLDSVPWAKIAINRMAEADIVAGDGNKLFRPNDNMTREEYVKMIVCAVDMYDKDAKCDFIDVLQGKWHYSYIASAYNNKLIFGKSDTEFGIGSLLTRQDMAVIAARAAERIKNVAEIRPDMEFADYDSISEYARESIGKLYRAGIINGIDENNFAPLEQATRAQGALIIYNLFLNN